MEYRFLKKYLSNNKSLTITDLSKKINVSRQTIYDWNEKGIIPKKYEKVISEMICIDNDIKCNIEFEISYDDISKVFLILDIEQIIVFSNGELIINIIDEYGTNKNFKINSGNYNVIFEKTVDVLDNLFLNVVRYETNIDYKNNIVKYILYCSTFKKKKYFMSPINRNIFLSLKNKLKYNIDENINFKDIINYIKYNELDAVIVVNEDEMELLYNKLSCKKDIGSSRIKTMGMYVKYVDSFYTEIDSILGNKFRKIVEYYNGYYKYLNLIFLCVDNIKSNLEFLKIKYLDELDKLSLTIRNDGLLIDFNDLIKYIFAHECGHLIFSYNFSGDILFEERRANYFVSFILDGRFDYFNLFFTVLQPWMYHEPLVKPDLELIYNLAFCKKTFSKNFKTLDYMYDIYYKEVDKLYEK